MIMTTLPIKPKDFGTKVRILNGHRGAFGRAVEDNYCRRELAANWDSIVKESAIRLFFEDGIYWILDGQHRIKEGAFFKQETITWNVLLCGPGDLTAGRQLSDLVLTSNRNRKFCTNHVLETTKAQSVLPDVFAKHGLFPIYRGGKTHLSWTNIIRGIVMAQQSMARNGITSTSSREEGIVSLWTGMPAAEAEKWAQAIVWWEQAARGAQESLGIDTLRSYMGIGIGVAIYFTNAAKKKAVAEAPARLLAWPHVMTVKGEQRTTALAIRILHGINFKRQEDKYRLTLCGITGDEPIM